MEPGPPCTAEQGWGPEVEERGKPSSAKQVRDAAKPGAPAPAPGKWKDVPRYTQRGVGWWERAV